MPQFSWKPLYRQIAERVLTYREKQTELVALLQELKAQGLNVVKFHDQYRDGGKGPLKEIDPFTFIASYNRSTTSANRIALLTALKKEWKLAAPVPEDFDGLPVMNPVSAWFLEYETKRDKNDVPALWTLAELSFSDTSTDGEVGDALQACLSQHGGNLRSLTMGMFWVNPDRFLSLAGPNREYSASIGVPWDETDRTPEQYLTWLAAIRKKAGSGLPEFSHAAYQFKKTAPESAETKTVKTSQRNVWLVAAGLSGREWENFRNGGYIAIGWSKLENLKQFKTVEDLIRKLAQLYPNEDEPDKSPSNDGKGCYDFANNFAVGDLVVAKQGRSTVYGIGVVEGDYTYLPEMEHYRHRRKVRWLDVQGGDLDEDAPKMATKTVTKITENEELLEAIEKLLGIEFETAGLDQPIEAEKALVEAAPFSLEQACENLFMAPAELQRLLSLLDRKRNVILQGPPGVGKTFAAKLIAYARLGGMDSARIERVQFHPSYSYEDFIQGIRPRIGGGFELKDGVFLTFCKKAAADPSRRYVFVIDEINRGNLSKVLGEVMMLIEPDKRGEQLPLMYSPESKFAVPTNVDVIGTMNTADRSISIVDYALRRRFAFHDLKPAFANEKFVAHLTKNKRPDAIITRIQKRITALNAAISSDTRNLGPGYEIGHSFFCDGRGDDHEAWYQDIVTYEIEPLLREYWIDNKARCDDEVAKLRQA